MTTGKERIDNEPISIETDANDCNYRRCCCNATSLVLPEAEEEENDINRREIGHATWTDRGTDRAIVMGRQ